MSYIVIYMPLEQLDIQGLYKYCKKNVDKGFDIDHCHKLLYAKKKKELIAYIRQVLKQSIGTDLYVMTNGKIMNTRTGASESVSGREERVAEQMVKYLNPITKEPRAARFLRLYVRVLEHIMANEYRIHIHPNINGLPDVIDYVTQCMDIICRRHNIESFKTLVRDGYISKTTKYFDEYEQLYTKRSIFDILDWILKENGEWTFSAQDMSSLYFELDTRDTTHDEGIKVTSIQDIKRAIFWNYFVKFMNVSLEDLDKTDATVAFERFELASFAPTTWLYLIDDLMDSVTKIIKSRAANMYGYSEQKGTMETGDYCKTGEDCATGCCNIFCSKESFCRRSITISGLQYDRAFDNYSLFNLKFLTEDDKQHPITNQLNVSRDMAIKYMENCHNFFKDNSTSLFYPVYHFTFHLDGLINPVLRSDAQYGTAIAKFVQGMDRTLSLSPVPQGDIYVYRGMQNVDIKWKIGKKYVWSGFTSTSFDPITALRQFGSFHTITDDRRTILECCNLLIRIPAGTRNTAFIADISQVPGEFELLLGKNAVIQVIDTCIIRGVTRTKEYIGRLIICDLVGYSPYKSRFDARLDARFVSMLHKTQAQLEAARVKDPNLRYFDMQNEPFQVSESANITVKNLLYQIVEGKNKMLQKYYRNYTIHGTMGLHTVGSKDHEQPIPHIALWGLFIGDALGSTFEFMTASSIKTAINKYPSLMVQSSEEILALAGTLPDKLRNVPWKLVPGQVTDDSEMAINILESIRKHGYYDVKFSIIEHIRWLKSKPFDIGDTTRKSLEWWYDHRNSDISLQNLPPTVPSNGGLMRVGALAMYAIYMPLHEIYTLAAIECAITHNNAIAQDACGVFLVAVVLSLKKEKPLTLDFLLQFAQTPEVMKALKDGMNGIKPVADSGHIGSATLSLQMAFWAYSRAVKRAVQSAVNGLIYSEIIRDVIMAGGDTDTNGAISGCLVAAYLAIHNDQVMHFPGIYTVLADEDKMVIKRPKVYNIQYNWDDEGKLVNLWSYDMTRKAIGL